MAATARAYPQPTITQIERFPVVVNDEDTPTQTLEALRHWLGSDQVLDPSAGAGSVDVGTLATPADAPLRPGYWGARPAARFVEAG